MSRTLEGCRRNKVPMKWNNEASSTVDICRITIGWIEYNHTISIKSKRYRNREKDDSYIFLHKASKENYISSQWCGLFQSRKSLTSTVHILQNARIFLFCAMKHLSKANGTNRRRLVIILISFGMLIRQSNMELFWVIVKHSIYIKSQTWSSFKRRLTASFVTRISRYKDREFISIFMI